MFKLNHNQSGHDIMLLNILVLLYLFCCRHGHLLLYINKSLCHYKGNIIELCTVVIHVVMYYYGSYGIATRA